MIPPDTSLVTLIREMEGFIALLEEEALALVSGDPERLARLSGDRRAASLRIGDLWRGLASRAGVPPQAGFQALRDKILAGAPPSRTWQSLEQLTREASRLNQVNGRLIDEQMRRNQAAIQVLQNAVADRGLYGSDGRVSDFLQVNRSIDTA